MRVWVGLIALHLRIGECPDIYDAWTRIHLGDSAARPYVLRRLVATRMQVNCVASDCQKTWAYIVDGRVGESKMTRPGEK